MLLSMIHGKLEVNSSLPLAGANAGNKQKVNWAQTGAAGGCVSGCGEGVGGVLRQPALLALHASRCS